MKLRVHPDDHIAFNALIVEAYDVDLVGRILLSIIPSLHTFHKFIDSGV